MKPFSREQYDFLLRKLCPFCQYGIPDVYECHEPQGYHVHTISDARISEKCWADRIRGKLPLEEPEHHL